MKLSKETQNQINNWKQLKEFDGFNLLVKKLDDIIEDSEKIIFAIGADSDKEFSKRDVAILKRDNAMELKELPDRMIKQLSDTGVQPHDNPDPYQDVNDSEEELDEDVEKELEEDFNS